jgi:DNA-binding CsgD family transcriptional regulator
MDQSWEFWTRAEGYRLSEWEGGETSRWFTDWVRESVNPAGIKAAVRALKDVDVTALLPEVRAPSLVLHRTGLAAITVEMAREMASRISGARLMLLDGSWIVPYLGPGGKDTAPLIRSFLIERPEAPPSSLSAQPGKTALTPRETEILSLVAAGKTTGEISHELSLSIRTVGRHITNIYNKIGARTRVEATAYALRNRLA